MDKAQIHQQQAEARKIEDEEPPVVPEHLADTELGDKVDALLEDIDAVLEENAEEFVQGYIQLGGQ